MNPKKTGMQEQHAIDYSLEITTDFQEHEKIKEVPVCFEGLCEEQP